MMIKIIGLAVMIVGAMMIRADVIERRRKRVLLCEELYRFILHIRLQISCFLKKPNELALGFESNLCEIRELLSKLSSGERVGQAFSKSGISEKLTKDEGRILSSLFSEIGSGYMEEQLKLIDGCSAEFYSLLVAERENIEKDIRLINTVSASITIGFLIFLI